MLKRATECPLKMFLRRRYLRVSYFLLFISFGFLFLYITNKPEKLREEPQLDHNFGYFDSSGKFKIHSHVHVASEWNQLNQVGNGLLTKILKCVTSLRKTTQTSGKHKQRFLYAVYYIIRFKSKGTD